MPVSVACDACGKRLTVRDQLVGKKLKCPACQHVFTPVAEESAPARPAAGAGTPKIAVSGGLIKLGLVGVAVAVLVWIAYVGFVGNRDFLDQVEPKARDDIEDVLVRGLQVHQGGFGGGLLKPSSTPQLRDLVIRRAVFGLTHPKELTFQGATSEGRFSGKYVIAGGEVELETEVGAVMVPGLAAVAQEGYEKIKITGRNKDNKLTVEINGKPVGE